LAFGSPIIGLGEKAMAIIIATLPIVQAAKAKYPPEDQATASSASEATADDYGCFISGLKYGLMSDSLVDGSDY
jgi:hypothetical protein